MTRAIQRCAGIGSGHRYYPTSPYNARTSADRTKARRGRIEPGEWRALAYAYAKGHVPDYQMAAFLMACFLRGLDRGETRALTEAMLRSGDTPRSRAISDEPRVDKHSTGGVGDKVSLVLAPLVASLGVVVPMMSGRGLGHTGGTLDKLESIPGFRTDLTLAQARAQIEQLGCALIGQTAGDRAGGQEDVRAARRDRRRWSRFRSSPRAS